MRLVRRLLLPLVCCALGGCETLVAIDKAMYATTEALTEKDRVTGARSLSLADRAGQIARGNQAAEAMIADARAKGKKVNGELDPAMYQRIVTIFNRLHSVSHLREESWHPTLLESERWNAFTTGGTYFVVHSALAKELSNDDELAAVIAHEMAHTAANHGFERTAYLQLNAMGGSKSAKRDSFAAAFTHENEIEADRIGVLYCALAGYDPTAAARIWQRQHASRGSSMEMVRTHPTDVERARLARHAAAAVMKHYSAGQTNPNFEAILGSNELFAKRAHEPAAGKGGGLAAALSAALSTYAQREKAKAEEQRQRLQRGFVQSATSLTTVVASKPIARNVWRFTLRYGGYLTLTDLSFRAAFRDRTGRPVSANRSLKGALRPNTTFTVDFLLDSLQTHRIDPRSAQVSITNARAI